jgi:putative autotransporter adhesin-like protein
MKIKWLVICLSIALFLTGCAGQAKLAKESRFVDGLNTIVFTTDGTLNIVQGESEALTVEAAEDILSLIETEVKDEVLTIQLEDGSKSNPLLPQVINYTLTVKDLTTLEVDGRGAVNITDLKTNHLEVVINGSAIVSALGVVTSQKVTIAGMGHYDAPDMASEETTVINDYGLVTVWVSKRLNITLTSVGKVFYYGSPEIIQSISGGGKVVSSGDK